MHSFARSFAVAGLAAVSLTCADQSVGVRGRLAFLPIAPVFLAGPDGGPDIEIETVRGVLRNQSGTDSTMAEAPVRGDSAILEFIGVIVRGDSTTYNLGVQALDANNVVVFEGNQDVSVKPGENAPAAPVLEYTAPDAVASTIEIQVGGQSASATALQWAGAQQGNLSCLNRQPSATAVTQVQLAVVGRTAAPANAVVPSVRVGWTSLDTTVATVDENGLVRSRCSNKSTQIIARTFLDKADTITVTVTAPPFTLLMSPEVANVARGATQVLTAVVADENGNSSPATGVTWSSSDPTRATVTPDADGTATVAGIRNGRVQITANAGDRTTVGIIEVVRPAAAAVKVIPQQDTIAFGQVRQYFARAFDVLGRVIADATEFQWSSSRTGVATINASTGVATGGTGEDTTTLSATIDGKTGKAELKVVSALPPGTIIGVVTDAATDAPLAGVSLSVAGGTPVTSNADGRFSLPGVKQGDNITVSKSGYVTIDFFDAPAFPNQTILIPTVPMSPTSTSNGTLQGKVVNALTAGGISGLTISAYKGLNSAPSPRRPDVQPDFTATSTSGGSFTFSNVPPGAYTLLASGTGYAQGVGVGISVGGVTKTASDIIMPPAVTGNALFVVLTWASSGLNVPADLDLHITGPVSSTDTTRFQVHSGHRAFVAGPDTIATIDVPDATGPGPEVGSLRGEAPPAFYRFYVKNKSQADVGTSRALADSAKARVDVFQGNRVIATFFPPSGVQGTVWEVFKFDGARIFPGGTITHPPDPAVLGMRIGQPERAVRPPKPPGRP